MLRQKNKLFKNKYINFYSGSLKEYKMLILIKPDQVLH